MRRSTSLLAQLNVQPREGTELHFKNCTGGYFSDDPNYALKVMGRNEQGMTAGKNLFPLGDLYDQCGWANVNGQGIMTSDEVMSMLEPLTTYTISFDAECVRLPDDSIVCNQYSVCYGYGNFGEDWQGTHSLAFGYAHSGLGFVLAHPDENVWFDHTWCPGLPDEDRYREYWSSYRYPLIHMFVEHRLGVGEKYHGVVTFQTPENLDGYTLQALTNQYYYQHYDHPEMSFSTVTFTNIQIEKGTVATTYEAYSGGQSIPHTKCVKAGSVIICGDSRVTVPCDLQIGDIWYPSTGIVHRGDSMEKYTPQHLLASTGDFSVIQEPVELEARLSATMLTRNTDNELSWKDIQTIVRCGLATKYFKVGDRLTCQRGDRTLVWDVIGIDHDTPTDKSLKHSLTLQLHDCFISLPYDAVEALFYAEEELPAGTYNFTLLEGHDTDYGGGRTYSFTLSKSVPAGGVIMFPWGIQKQAEDTLVSTYRSLADTEAIESVPVAEGAEGTALEDLGECNHTHRIRYGSNNWRESAVRQYINSDAAAGGAWTAKTSFDRPFSKVEITEGFLYGMDEDFLEVVGEVDKVTVLNNIVDGGDSETNVERFFLLSRSEAYGSYEGGIREGEAYPYYADKSDLTVTGQGADSNRIKHSDGTPKTWWLRTPNYSLACDARIVNNTGNVNSTKAFASYGIAPACCII